MNVISRTAGLLLSCVLALGGGAAPAWYDATTYAGTDAQKIQSAINAASAAGGGVVYLPPRTYSVNTTIDLASNVVVQGDGAASIVSFNVSDAGFRGQSVSNVTIRDLKIAGTSARAIYIDKTSTQSQNVTVQNCIITGATNSVSTAHGPMSIGVHLRDTIHSRILFNDFDGIGSSTLASSTSGTQAAEIVVSDNAGQIEIAGNRLRSTNANVGMTMQGAVERITITGNAISGKKTTTDNNSWGYGIVFYNDTGTENCRYNVIADNRISDTQGQGIYLNEASYTNVIGNNLINTCSTNANTNNAVGAIGAGASARIVIADNVIKTSGRAGIRVDASNSSVTGNSIYGTAEAAIHIGSRRNDVTIANNTVHASAEGLTTSFGTSPTGSGLTVTGNAFDFTSVTGSGSGVFLSYYDNVTITGNSVTNARASGIYVDHLNAFTIGNNTIRSASQQTSTTWDGIGIANCTRGTVNGNLSSGSSQRYGITVYDSSSYLEVNDNHLTANGTGALLNNSTTTTIAGNRYTTNPAQGRVTLSAGTATVSSADVVSGDNILLTVVVPGGTPGAVRVSSISSGSFTIASTSAADASTVFWKVVH